MRMPMFSPNNYLVKVKCLMKTPHLKMYIVQNLFHPWQIITPNLNMYTRTISNIYQNYIPGIVCGGGFSSINNIFPQQFHCL